MNRKQQQRKYIAGKVGHPVGRRGLIRIGNEREGNKSGALGQANLHR
jgi:hypothetical protein